MSGFGWRRRVTLHAMKFLRYVLPGILAAACSGSETAGPPPAPVPAAIALVSGGDQVAPAGTKLPAPIVVKVTAADGQLVPGAIVTFGVPAGSGSVAPAFAITDARGEARTDWTLGRTLGSATLFARVGELREISIGATAVAGPPVRLTVVSGGTQTAPAGSVLPAPVVVRVADAQDNPVAGATVDFAVTVGGGAVSPARATTDGNGQATAQWTLGASPGTNTITATVGGVTPLAVTATGTVVGASRTVLRGGDNQTVLAGLPLPDSLVVEVLDQAGQPVPGIQVRFITSSGSTNPATPLTGSNGRVAVIWTPVAPAGPKTLTVQVTGVPDLTVNATTTGAALVGVSAGTQHACALDAGGAAFCWGQNVRGALGNGTTSANPSLAPVAVTGGNRFTALAPGGDHTCGLSTGGAILCWGNGASGQIGNNATPAAQTTPATVSGGQQWTALTSGFEHTCALAADGSPWCWGRNNVGQLGDGTTTNARVPVQLQGRRFTAIAAGLQHTCGVESGSLWCWGRNAQGQLGDGTTTDRNTPVQVLAPAGVSFTQVAAGDSHTCALTTAGAVYCWGQGGQGQLGLGNANSLRQPTTPIPGATVWSGLTAGDFHSCAIGAGGVASCWGLNTAGQLGDGTTTTRGSTAAVQGGVNFVSLDAGSASVCGTGSDARSYCWGANAAGQLGIGSALTPRPAPSGIATP